MPNRHLRRTFVALAAALLSTAAAQAQVHHHARRATPSSRAVLLAEVKAPPLTIQKRSFLDPGNVVPVGSDTPEYVAANTTEHIPVYAGYAPARFGESTLPGRFDLPNNPRFYPQQDLDFSPF